MSRPERVAENLNRALHHLFEHDPRTYLLGEDIADPYGGAFKITRGLSTRFPQRVLTSPLSEGGIVGVGAGLALMGDTRVVEIMFGDFVALGFDQLLNFASKSVSMYGREVPMRMVVRCPSGGNRGYGPTHSQSLHKHFVGIPRLSLFELSPFHDATAVFDAMIERGEPCVLFEDKVLYTQPMYSGGTVDDLFRYEFVEGSDVARVYVVDEAPDWTIIAPGGLTERVLAAARSLLLERETVCEILIPSRLYPFDPTPLLGLLARAGGVCVVEDGTADGSWGEHLAQLIHTALWGRLRQPVRLVSSARAIIPTAPHLERRVVVQESTIRQALAEANR
ncbi:alpha-ketoacid dehydrogenase subunit beta [Actinospica robiniae]|uniref:alpha-ketoacid dehydrogenase subunit beta n=1 Tax=Actinospica robiniae TaxID=304901 RepID=UPI0004152EE6|nr:transketolase C-terminal domain-containing protein [Actinospica robiniae]